MGRQHHQRTAGHPVGGHRSDRFGGAFSGAVVKLIEAGAPVKAVINYYGEDAKSFNGFYVKEDSPIRTAA